MSARVCRLCQEGETAGRPVVKVGEHHAASAGGLTIYEHADHEHCGPMPERRIGGAHRSALEEAAQRAAARERHIS